MLRSVDTAASQPDEIALPGAGARLPEAIDELPPLPPELLEELWKKAGGNSCGLTVDEFGATLCAVGKKCNFGAAPGAEADAGQKAAFLRSLHLDELALAGACALGREPAWERFVGLYRAALDRAGAAIAGSAALGEELAGSLYGELYGTRTVDGERKSPLASYSGRGSLLGWLRATLAQRYQDHLRRTRREEPLDDFDSAAPETPASTSNELAALAAAIANALAALPAEDRFLLAAHYLDGQTLLEIGRTLRLHEATISRRLKRLLVEIRKQLVRNLVSGGLSKAAAGEALGVDPRDLKINLRALLQDSQLSAFSGKESAAQSAESDGR